MSTPMDVDEVPPAQQEQPEVKGKTKDVAEKKRFEVKKVICLDCKIMKVADPFLSRVKWNAVALWAWGKYQSIPYMQRA